MFRWFIGGIAALLLIVGMALGVMAIGASRRAELSTGGSLAAQPEQPFNGADAAQDSGWLSEYTLTERSGRKFHSRDLSGQVHVVNFFFTACPTVCRMQTAAVQTLAKEFGPRGVTFLSITCDPETDTPVELTLYANQFQADPKQWLFLTGDLPYLRRVGAEVYFLPVDRGTHSESLVLLDRQGKIRGRFNWKKFDELADMKNSMTELLAEPAADTSQVESSASSL